MQRAGLHAAHVGNLLLKARDGSENFAADQLQFLAYRGQAYTFADLFQYRQTDGFGEFLDLH